MIKTLKYQEKAVSELVDKMSTYLHVDGDRHIIVLEAPTGSGKTVMASNMLAHLNDVEKQVAYIWLAPNKLHEQSYFKLTNYFTETNELRPILSDSMDRSSDGIIKAGEILFLNWESINKENALLIRETEANASLIDIVQRTKEEGLAVGVIIDEEHEFTGKNAKQSEKVLDAIKPKVELHISATPKQETKAKMKAFINVERSEVIDEQMIKKGINLNPALEFEETSDTLNEQLIWKALEKRNELAEAYKAEGSKVNPLLLIQLPNDNSTSLNEEENKIKLQVTDYLKLLDITTENNRLAIWLSNEKVNLENIEKENNITEVLLFKQAIAKGWDCPRAAVLLIFREMKNYTFTAQTVGRILRMPEQKHYADNKLNYGYVYTNLSKGMIEIVKDEMSYFSHLLAYRRKDLNNVSLSSVYTERLSIDRKRLRSDFKYFLGSFLLEKWNLEKTSPALFTPEEMAGEESSDNYISPGENRAKCDWLVFDVKKIRTDVLKDAKSTGELGYILSQQVAHYTHTAKELQQQLRDYCEERLGNKFEKVSVPTLYGALVEVLHDLFDLDEIAVCRVVLYHANKPKFTQVIDEALEAYLEKVVGKLKARQKDFKEYTWEVPPTRSYKEETHRELPAIKNHALNPFIELKNASDTEGRFESFLEQHTAYIDWWYKNGDAGREHYAIGYMNSKRENALFYVDFVVRMNNGKVYLFDTKSIGSDDEAANKHNALVDYMKINSTDDTPLDGGVIVQAHNGNWLYPTGKILNTEDISKWQTFFPDLEQ